MYTIRPFRVEISGGEIDDLRGRLARARWPEQEPVDDWSMGIPLAYVQELAGYWAESYEMQRVAVQLNRYEQFTTSIDGVDIHFIRVRSPVEGATPCVMTHGWPGSVIEFIKVIDPLVDPVSHGGEAFDALELVIPSLPGYGWSGKPTVTGWNVEKIARAWIELMDRLGYERWVAQLAMLAGLATQIGQRIGALYEVMAGAAGADPEIATLFGRQQDARHRDQRRLARSLSRRGYLRPGLSERRATDIMWALANPTTHRALVGDQGWAPEQYEHWLADLLACALLPGRRSPGGDHRSRS